MRLILLITASLLTVVTFQNCAGHNSLGAEEVVETDLSSFSEEAQEEQQQEMAMKSTTAPSCINSKAAYVAKLNNVYEFQGIRVFYSVDPKNLDAVKNLTDKNKNKYPDYVEDIAKQIAGARAGLNELGFMDPVQSPRFKAYGVKFIDVHIRNLSGNGLAYDEPVNYTNNPLKKNACAIRIDLSNDIEAFPGGWSVGAHELFHLYEYGYTMFKRSWFLEGMAAWGERVVRLGGLKSNGLTPLPANSVQLNEQVLAVPYNFLWDRLAYLSEANKNVQFPLSTAQQNRTYADGTKVFRDQKLLGIKIMKSILENLNEESNAISAQKGRSNFFWIEEDQRSPENDKAMIKAVQRAIKESGLDKLNTAEMNAFLAIH